MKFKYLLRVLVGLSLWVLAITGIFWVYNHDVESKIPAVKEFASYFDEHYTIFVLYDHEIKAKIGDPIYFNDPEQGLIKIGEVDEEISKQKYYADETLGEVKLLVREDLKYWMKKNPELNLKKLNSRSEEADIYFDVKTQTAFVQDVSKLKSYRVREKWQVVFWIDGYRRNYVSEDLKFKYCNSPNDIGAILSTLFDENTKARIGKKISSFRDKYEDRFAELFVPFLKAKLSEYYSLIEDDISKAFENHQDDFEEMFKTLYDGKIQEEMLPLIEKKAIPEFNKKMKPKLIDLGMSLWESIPKLNFGWQYLTSSTEEFMKKFDEWLVEEGYPIIDKHKEGLVDSVENIVNTLAYDKDIADEFQEILQDFLSNPKLGETLMEMMQEIIIDNPETVQFFKDLWASDELQAKLASVGSMIEPLLVSISDDILLDLSNPGDKKINPNLVKVLRSQILWKDDFWWVATSTKPDEFLPVKSGHVFK